jgi:ABC-type branched-subunit amino acid transport system ATPase component/sugar phosphate permease
MAVDTPDRVDDPAALVASVLDEEAKRQAAQAAADAEAVVLPDDLLPGVGGESMPLRDVVRAGGVSTIAVLFGLGMVDNLINNGAFQVLAPDIQDEFGLSDGAIGIIGSLAAVTLFLTALPLGSLGDRMRRTLIAGVCTIAWSVFAFLTGVVSVIWQLVVCRVVTGMGQANEQPIQSAILADAYPPEGRGRIFGIHRGASTVGLMLGPAAAGAIAAVAGGDDGWRWSFVILAVPVAILGVIALFLPEPKRGRHEQLAVLGEELDEGQEPPLSLGAAFARLKKIRSFYYLMAALGAFGMAITTVPIYLNLILEDHLHLSAGSRGVLGSITYTGAVIGAFVGGRYADVLFRRSPESTFRFAGAALAALGVGFAFQAYAPNRVMYAIFGIIAQGCLYAGIVPASPAVAAIVPYRLRSTGYAMVGLYLALVGGLGGAILLGIVSDITNTRMAVAIVAPASCLIAAALLAHGSRFVRQDIARSVADLMEERDERERVAAGGEIPVLQVHNIDFSYGQVQVLFDVSLEVQRGEVLALLGTNGAGKSTVLRVISGIALPTRGVVRLNGKNVTFTDAELRVRSGIVQVPGGKAIFPTLTVGENLVAGAYGFVWDTERVQSRVDEVLDLFPVLRDRLDQAAGTLSGGEQQMLALAKALLLDPEILIIDELSLGLAPVVVQQLLEIVERLKERGITMIIVEQSVNVALSIADRAIFMEKGQVRFEGPAQDLLERDDLVRAVFFSGQGG